MWTTQLIQMMHEHDLFKASSINSLHYVRNKINVRTELVNGLYVHSSFILVFLIAPHYCIYHTPAFAFKSIATIS